MSVVPILSCRGSECTIVFFGVYEEDDVTDAREGMATRE
jgi:hypothetical protein